MPSQLVDPFDAPPAPGGGLIDPFDEVKPEVVADPNRAPSIGRVAAASLATEFEPRARLFAEQLFPDEPIEVAIKRFGTIGDEIVFKDKDGQVKTVTPGIARKLAATAGPSIPAAGALAGAAITAPLVVASGGAGVPATVAAAGLGAAGGEELRSSLSAIFLEQDKSVRQRAVDALTEGCHSGHWRGRGRGRRQGLAKPSRP